MDEKEEIEKKQKNWGPGGGMYRGVNVPVKILNYVIITLMVILVGVVVFLALNSHFTVSFEGWYLDQDLKHEWDPLTQKVEQSMTLYASWKPIKINVVFDYDGGNVILEHKEVIYDDIYGELPRPTKEGYQFLGWIYNNEFITENTTVSINGEHVLKALWQSQ